MSLLSKIGQTTLALGFLSLLILISLGQKFSQSGETNPVEAASEGSGTTYLPMLKVSGPYPAESINIEPFVTGLQTDTITEIKHAGDSRLFIAEREGYIRVVQPDGTVLPTPFLDISGPTLATDNWEQGLIGLEFHPNYAANGYFYIMYTTEPNSAIRVMRYTVSADPNVANPSSGQLFFDIAKPISGDGQPSKVHNGGSMHFGPDGYLYISIGDGGPDPWIGNNLPGDPFNNSQRLNTLLGKILRIDVNGNDPECGTANYSIPPSNPYAGTSGSKCDEIWASGLRNPWRMSFDRLTGELYIGDVGEWQFEEINYQPAGSEGGENYGWHCFEGTLNYVLLHPEIGPDCQQPLENYTFPIFEYPHGSPCSSVTAGYVYRGYDFPEIYGQYIFGDFCTGRVWRTALVDGVWETALVADLQVGISTFGEDVDGELYIGSFMTGTVYRIVD